MALIDFITQIQFGAIGLLRPAVRTGRQRRIRYRLRSDARSQPVRSKHAMFKNLIGGDWVEGPRVARSLSDTERRHDGAAIHAPDKTTRR
jgi:hypothetical protein